MAKRIELDIPKDIDRLAGNPFGEEIYYKSVKNAVDFSDMNIIIIPNNIEDIAISFVQGFTCHIFEMISKDEFYKYFKIEGNEKVINKFKKGIYY